ncbi:25404_t:CDS:2 [Dentiscutata erythropus]|uniref:25404_t:CDS:1 n=1 Tax=Dentiscutata erythropus TaxID=1348616 RepID=A0A9N8YYS8_9GLOM|nr:25404_t:CDS:2 [Dentiscutata erythropus]
MSNIEDINSEVQDIKHVNSKVQDVEHVDNEIQNIKDIENIKNIDNKAKDIDSGKHSLVGEYLFMNWNIK